MKKYTNIAAIWVKETKTGDKYLSFKADRDIRAGENLSLFKNDKGDNPLRPDFRAYTVEELGDDVAQDAMEALANNSKSDDSTPF